LTSKKKAGQKKLGGWGRKRRRKNRKQLSKNQQKHSRGDPRVRARRLFSNEASHEKTRRKFES